MVFSVSDVKIVAGERQTLRTIKSCFIKRAVRGAGFASTDCFYQRTVEFCNNDAIVICIGDEESIGICVRENLARKRQRQFADLGAFENEFERLLVQFAPFAKLLDRLG